MRNSKEGGTGRKNGKYLHSLDIFSLGINLNRLGTMFFSNLFNTSCASLVRVRTFSNFRFLEGVEVVEDFLFFFEGLDFFSGSKSSNSYSLSDEETRRREEVGDSGGSWFFFCFDWVFACVFFVFDLLVDCCVGVRCFFNFEGVNLDFFVVGTLCIVLGGRDCVLEVGLEADVLVDGVVGCVSGVCEGCDSG